MKSNHQNDIEVAINIDSDTDSNDTESDAELLIDWRGTGTGSFSYPKRRNSFERATPAKKKPDAPPSSTPTHAAVDLQVVADTPVSSFSQPGPGALDSGRVDAICLDFDDELDGSTMNDLKDEMILNNIDFEALSISQTNGGWYESVASLPARAVEAAEASASTPVDSENSAKVKPKVSSKGMLQTDHNFQVHEGNVANLTANIDCGIDTGIVDYESLGTVDGIGEEGLRNSRNVTVQDLEGIDAFSEELSRGIHTNFEDGENPSQKGTVMNDDTLVENLEPNLRFQMGNEQLEEISDHECVQRTLIKDSNVGKLSNYQAMRKRREEEMEKKKILKEEKLRQKEEQRLKKEEERMQKAAEKAKQAGLKKYQKEMEKWGKGKYALKAICLEIDSKVIEKGMIGGHLLSRLAEKEFSYHIMSNAVSSCIAWKMNMPDETCLGSFKQCEVPYVAFVLEAPEFCNMVSEGTINDHIYSTQRCYPGYNICYIINRLMPYIHKKCQEKYRNPNAGDSGNPPPVEEALARFSTHFVGVRSRLCMDEAEVADHIVRLTRSLAECRFRPKLSHLSVTANGLSVFKDHGKKEMIKQNMWLKVLIAIPKLPPKCAIAIAKKYPSMRSLLSVYLDPEKSVNEKEFLLEDLVTEGPLGDSGRRLGPVCSKRVYRILMAQNGNLKTDEVENGADLFESNRVL